MEPPVSIISSSSHISFPPSSHSSQETSITHEKTTQTAHQTLFKELARGAVKIVWVKAPLDPTSQDPLAKDKEDNVYYTPVDSFFEGKRKELEEEFKKMQVIANKADSIEHLAVNAKEINDTEKSEGSLHS